MTNFTLPDTNIKFYLPFGSTGTPPLFKYTNNAQARYIFSEDLFMTSGSVVILSMKHNNIPITSVIYFDNLAAQITSVATFQGTISMPIFTKILEANKDFGLFTPITTQVTNSSILNLNNFVIILIPKNYNRDWIFKQLALKNIILKSYLWKDKTIPSVLKDLNKYFNNNFRHNISPDFLKTSVDTFNKKVQKKLKDLENSPQNSSQFHVNNSNPTGFINKPLSINQIKKYSTWSFRQKNLISFSSSLLNIKHYFHTYNKQSFNKIEDYIKLPRSDSTIHSIHILGKGQITKLVEQFKEEISTLFKDNTHLLEDIKISTQFKIELEDYSIRSISAVDTIEYKDFKFLEESYIYNWEHKYAQRYSSLRVNKIFISYKILPSYYKRKLVSYISDVDYKKSFSPFKINAQMPKTMDIKMWGDISINKITESFEVWLGKSSMFARISIKNEFKNIISLFYKGIGMPIDFTDQRDSDDPTTFTRTFLNITYKFKKGVQVLFKQLYQKIEFISKLKPHQAPNLNFITMDLETKEKDGKLYPVCISLYIPTNSNKNSTIDSSIIKTFAIWDYQTAEEMIIAAFKFIMKRKYRGYNIYFHNFSYFDSIFIIKILANLPETQIIPNFRDGKLLKLTIKFDKRTNNTPSQPRYNCSIHILDSYLILPSSLDKLGKAFNVENPSIVKSIFPLKFLNKENLSLDYEGSVPDLKYFYLPDTLNIKAYNAFIDKYKLYKELFNNKPWNLKEELVGYCEQDVKVLYYVIAKFAQEIHSRFKVNIFKYPTLPSIAFAIYRTHYMKNGVIPIIKGKIYNDIKNAYYGGFVDVYKPYAENVNSYDVNSLYPTSMQNCMMPIGNPTYIEGSEMSLSEIFGFVYVKVHAPDLNTPILPYKNSQPPFSTRYPTGSWEGWYFTEELINAMKYGYKFDLIKGYHFKKGILFSDYVNTLYKIKQSVSPADPWYMISKLLLNSLYGRFGMSPEIVNNTIINNEDVEEFDRDPTIIISDMKELVNKTWIQYTKTSSDEDENSLNNISVPISAAIAAWSRIHMTHYIIKYSNDICYIDTDGIKVTCELDSQYVGDKLGQMKFEGNFSQAVFIAPKVYGGVSSNQMVSKAKGLKNSISYWVLKSLLSITEIKINQFKWHRDFSNATINVIDQIYTLSATENKRELVRDSLGFILSTRPYKMNNGEFINLEKFILYYLPKWVNFLAIPAPYLNLKYLLTSGLNLKYLLDLPKLDIIKLPGCINEFYRKIDYINLTGHLAILEEKVYIIELPAPKFLIPPKVLRLPMPEILQPPKVIALPPSKFIAPSSLVVYRNHK